MSRVIEVYRNEKELDDGSLLEIKCIINRQRGGSYDPADVDSEVYFRLSGNEVGREEVLTAITAQELDELVDDAKLSEKSSF